MSKTGRKIILVVDDDQNTRLFVEEKLKPLGQKVLAAANGSEALVIIRDQRGKLDLLLSDVEMPGMNGIELAEAMTSEAPHAKIILMSGCIKPALKVSNFASYKKGFIQKPFSGKTLVSHIKKALIELESKFFQ